MLAVHDLRATARFFVDALGFRLVGEPPGWAFVARDACMVMLGECREALHPSKLGDHATFAYLVVDDVDALRREWEARGAAPGPVEDKPWGFREFTLRTPEGHRFTVGAAIRRAPATPPDPAAFAQSWLAAFNAGDLEAILAHYADGIEHASPTVVRLLGEPSGVVRGKAALRAYYEKALAAAGPGLRYDMTKLYVGVRGLTMLYNRSGGKLVAETFELDADGRIERSYVAHAEP